jgi:hypothetical protein
MPQTDHNPLRTRSREWIPVSYSEDEILARMTVTYLEAARLEARLVRQDDCLCIEVPEDQFDRACEICDPVETPAAPLMQESAANTDIHASRSMCEQLNALQAARTKRRVRSLLLRFLAGAAILAAAIWVVSRYA